MITKEQVLENIKAKMGKAQKISDRTILETVEPLLCFANEETTLDDFVSKVYPSVNSTNANYINETTEFVKNYKSDETKIPPKTKAEVKTETTMIERSDEEKEMFEFYRQEKERVARDAKRKSVYDLASKDLQEDEKKRFETFFGTQQVAVDADETITAQSMIQSYTKFTKDFIGDDTAPFTSGGKAKTMDEEFSDIPITKI